MSVYVRMGEERMCAYIANFFPHPPPNIEPLTKGNLSGVLSSTSGSNQAASTGSIQRFSGIFNGYKWEHCPGMG